MHTVRVYRTVQNLVKKSYVTKSLRTAALSSKHASKFSNFNRNFRKSKDFEIISKFLKFYLILIKMKRDRVRNKKHTLGPKKLKFLAN